MRKIVLSALLLVPGAALASTAFDGTWKTRTDSVKTTGKADIFEVLDGVYTCESCVPEIKVKADGIDQKVTGHAYYDTVAVMVLSPTSIQIIEKQAGKRILGVTYSVSSDETTLTGKFLDYTGTQVATGTFTGTRRAPGPAGSHPVSGSWQMDRLSDANDALRTVSYQMTDEQFSMHWNGQSYNAKFDGKQYPVQHAPGQTMVSVKRIEHNTVDETVYRQGKAVDEIRLAAAKDGKTIEVTDKDLEHNQITTYTLDRQE